MTRFWRCRVALILLSIVLILTAASGGLSQSATVYFEQFLAKRLSPADAQTKWELEQFCAVSTNVVARRVLREYGAMFVAHDSVDLPEACVYPGEAPVRTYQKKLKTKVLDMNGVQIVLQETAAEALRTATVQAAEIGLKISPLDGPIAGGRSYGDTLMLWNSRFFPAIEFWVNRGRLTPADREAISALDLQKKIEKIIELESQGICFSTNRTRSIFTSTAPPGTSQHLALIAFDVVEYRNPDVRSILNRNGWYQTIIDDPGHFTYLGVPETELPGRGLIAVAKGGVMYWVPNLANGNLANKN